MKLSLPSWGSALVCCFLSVTSNSWWSKEAQAGTEGIARLDTGRVDMGRVETGRVDTSRGDISRMGDPPPYAASLGAFELDSSGKSPDLPIIHPLAKLDEQEIRDRVQQDLPSLGSMSVGAPNRGALMNSVQMSEGPYWRLNHPEGAWGTAETVEFLSYAIERVNVDYPGSPAVFIGDLSKEGGGFMKRHKSHQSGRDVDVGYYYLDKSEWYRRATAKNFDRERTWALLRTLLLDTPVQYIFVDRSLQVLLRDFALKAGEDPAWLRRVFQVRGDKDAVVRHRRGHATHFHVRFDNPVAELSALRASPWLVEGRLLPKRVAGYYKDLRRARAKQARAVVD